MSKVETIRIKHDGFPEGVIINKVDFDPAKHEVYTAKAKPEKKPKADKAEPTEKPEA